MLDEYTNLSEKANILALQRGHDGLAALAQAFEQRGPALALVTEFHPDIRGLEKQRCALRPLDQLEAVLHVRPAQELKLIGGFNSI